MLLRVTGWVELGSDPNGALELQHEGSARGELAGAALRSRWLLNIAVKKTQNHMMASAHSSFVTQAIGHGVELTEFASVRPIA